MVGKVEISNTLIIATVLTIDDQHVFIVLLLFFNLIRLVAPRLGRHACSRHQFASSIE